MIQIKPPWRVIHHEMLLHRLQSPLHPYILPWCYAHKNLLEVWNVLDRDLDREGLPVKNITEWQHIIGINGNRHALVVDCLHDSWASNFISTWAKAEPALLHQVDVGHSFGEVLVDLNIIVLILPVLQKHRPNRPMVSSGEEGKDWTARSRWSSDFDGIGFHVHLRQ